MRTAFRDRDKLLGQHMAMQGMWKGAAPPEHGGTAYQATAVCTCSMVKSVLLLLPVQKSLQLLGITKLIICAVEVEAGNSQSLIQHAVPACNRHYAYNQQCTCKRQHACRKEIMHATDEVELVDHACHTHDEKACLQLLLSGQQTPLLASRHTGKVCCTWVQDKRQSHDGQMI